MHGVDWKLPVVLFSWAVNNTNSSQWRCITIYRVWPRREVTQGGYLEFYWGLVIRHEWLSMQLTLPSHLSRGLGDTFWSKCIGPALTIRHVLKLPGKQKYFIRQNIPSIERLPPRKCNQRPHLSWVRFIL